MYKFLFLVALSLTSSTARYDDMEQNIELLLDAMKNPVPATSFSSNWKGTAQEITVGAELCKTAVTPTIKTERTDVASTFVQICRDGKFNTFLYNLMSL